MQLRRIVQVTVIVWSIAATTFSAEAKKPNVVIVITDDQGYGDVALPATLQLRHHIMTAPVARRLSCRRRVCVLVILMKPKPSPRKPKNCFGSTSHLRSWPTMAGTIANQMNVSADRRIHH